MPWWVLTCYNNNKFKILDKLINGEKPITKLNKVLLICIN